MTNLKSWYGVVFLILLAGGVMWAVLNGMPYINNLRANWEAKRLQAQWEKPYREDKYGGKTPEETYDMFLDALRKGDTTLASKYFIVYKQDLSKENILYSTYFYYSEEQKMLIKDGGNDKKYFTLIPNFILNHSTAIDQAVYSQLKRLTDETNKTICYPSFRYLKKQLKIGEGNLRKSIEYLIQHKWIEDTGKRKIITGGGYQFVQTYKISNFNTRTRNLT